MWKLGSNRYTRDSSNKKPKYIVMKEKANGIEFTNNKQQNNILNELNACRSDEDLCDVVLLVHGKRYPAHRAVLMVASNYFKAMFSLKMRESTATEIPIMEVESSIVEQLLNYIYTGALYVSKDDVQDLFVASDMLQIDEVKDMCVMYMTDNMTNSNCVDLYQFGETFHCDMLSEKALHYIRQLYPAISTTDALLRLTYQALSAIIQNDQLSLEPEGEVCVVYSILRWLNVDFETRLSQVSCLFSHVRWKSISTQSINTILQHPLIVGSEKLKDIILKASAASTLGPRHAKLVIAGGYLQSRTGPDCPRLCSVEALDLQTLTWSRLANLPLESTPPSFTHLLMLSGQLVALCLTYSNKESKSQFCLQKIYKYNVMHEQWLTVEDNSQSGCLLDTIWECLKANGATVSDHGRVYIVSHQGVYYVDLCCAGDDITVSDVKSLHGVPGYKEVGRCRQRMGLAVCSGHLYCMGGYDVHSKSEAYPTSDVYTWNDSSQTWLKKADLLTARSSMATAVLDGQIFVTGGVNTFRLCSVEKYDPHTDTWTKLRDMHKPRSYHMCMAVRGQLYVIGGQTYHKNEGRKVLNVCDVYYPEKNCWYSLPQVMSHARCLAAATVM